MRKRLTSYLFAVVIAAGGLLAAASAMAAHPSDIYLRDHTGKVIMSSGGVDQAFSSKGTCGHCHEYDKIEAHSYHTQLSANQHMGWNAWKFGNWNSGATKGKPWVQSPGHVGKW